MSCVPLGLAFTLGRTRSRKSILMELFFIVLLGCTLTALYHYYERARYEDWIHPGEYPRAEHHQAGSLDERAGRR